MQVEASERVSTFSEEKTNLEKKLQFQENKIELLTSKYKKEEEAQIIHQQKSRDVEKKLEESLNK